jgi:hypothetical protein
MVSPPQVFMEGPIELHIEQPPKNVQDENKDVFYQWLIAQLVECSFSVMKDLSSNLGADICSFGY